jgi:trehalose 6-phosphate synthase/phosphatase
MWNSNLNESSYSIQGISKGIVVRELMEKMESISKRPDFVLCIGDDGSDEDMFEAVSNWKNDPMIPENTEVFACTVGNKPSIAKYYLDDTDEVLKMLKALTETGQVA